MSYRCGVGSGLEALGMESGEARITCDGCGVRRPVVAPSSNNLMPPKWFFNGKPPPGWKGLRSWDGLKRWDLCAGCWKEPVEGKEGGA